MKLTPDQAMAIMIATWKGDPVSFVRQCLSADPDEWQVAALMDIANYDRISIRSGHGVGKTTFLAWVILWFLVCWFPCKIPCTANSESQLRDILWAELRKWHRRMMPGFRELLDVKTDRIESKSNPAECFAVARTARKENPEALQGFHQENLLFIGDEASGIHDMIFEVASGAMSTPGAKTVLTGNPTRGQGYFYNTHTKLRDRWRCHKVSSLDAKHASKDYAKEIADIYGIASNAYRVRVLGEFPTSDDDQVIPFELVESAVKRGQPDTGRFQEVWGVDVARFGDDRSALARRKGNILVEPIKFWQNKNTMQTAGIVAEAYENASEKPAEILVDVIGIGAGVVDRLRELNIPVRGVNVGESAAISDKYMRRRDELWFKAREWFAKEDCTIPDDANLIQELTSPSYQITSSGKLLVESKADMKKRGQRSPDIADAFILTFAAGVHRVDEAKKIKKYTGFKRRRTTSWMAA